MGTRECPECGGGYDPETGYCETCEGAMELFHIAAFTADWLEHAETPPVNAPARTVSRRRVVETVAGFLALEPALITIQRQMREES